jgi:hypothetical protein
VRPNRMSSVSPGTCAVTSCLVHSWLPVVVSPRQSESELRPLGPGSLVTMRSHGSAWSATSPARTSPRKGHRGAAVVVGDEGLAEEGVSVGAQDRGGGGRGPVCCGSGVVVPVRPGDLGLEAAAGDPVVQAVGEGQVPRRRPPPGRTGRPSVQEGHEACGRCARCHRCTAGVPWLVTGRDQLAGIPATGRWGTAPAAVPHLANRYLILRRSAVVPVPATGAGCAPGDRSREASHVMAHAVAPVAVRIMRGGAAR